MTTPVVALSAQSAAEAARILADGGLVAIPTETVYGLAADSANADAVARLYEAKGRPAFNPLIAHVSGLDMAKRYGVFHPTATALAETFWPGPLTLVLPRTPGCGVADLATAGHDTIALRTPAAPLVCAIIDQLGRAIVAPSANPSGFLSPTTAHDVALQIGGSIDLILDGGPCKVGLESAIVRIEDGRAALLRPGALASNDIERIAGPLRRRDEADAPRAPGMLERHYAPHRARLRLDASAPAPGEAYLGFGDSRWATLNLSAAGDVREAAANLFTCLRALDRAGYGVIAVAPIPATGLGEAVNDRLRRAVADK